MTFFGKQEVCLPGCAKIGDTVSCVQHDWFLLFWVLFEMCRIWSDGQALVVPEMAVIMEPGTDY